MVFSFYAVESEDNTLPDLNFTFVMKACCRSFLGRPNANKSSSVSISASKRFAKPETDSAYAKPATPSLQPGTVN